MTEQGEPLVLVASLRGMEGKTYAPEQSVAVDLVLQNQGKTPLEAVALSGNNTTPTYLVFEQDTVVRQGNLDSLLERYGAEMGEQVERPPATAEIPAGKSLASWINLYSYFDALPRGKYEFVARHNHLPGRPGQLDSNRLPFEVADAAVSAVAFAFESPQRQSALLAWVATPTQGKPMVLFRLSTEGRFSAAQIAGRLLGLAAPGTQVALSSKPVAARSEETGWLALNEGEQVELVRHHMTDPTWRSARITWPGEGIHLIPGFPDRGHGVVLAAGQESGQPRLMGFPIGKSPPPAAGKEVPDAKTAAGPRPAPPTAQLPPPVPWTVPLLHAADHAACVFEAMGPITLLLVARDEKETLLSRLQVDEDGQVTTPEKLVRRSEHDLLALVADMRKGQPLGFVALESEREHPEKLTLVRIPAAGDPVVQPLEPKDWPMVVEQPPADAPPGAEGKARPARTARVDLSVAPDGVALWAFVDELGRFYGGALDGSPLKALAPAETQVMWPLVAALRESASYSGFTAQGVLAHLGSR